MQRYFIPNQNWQGQHVIITDDDYHHVVNVMRKQEGDQLICCHPGGQAYYCEINSIIENQVSCNILNKLEESNELPIHITVAQGLPKGDKLDLIVQKSTELGMGDFVPLQMDRTIVKWDHKKEQKKLDRLRKIAKEASEQSHRSRIPAIHNKQTIDTLLQDHSFDVCLVASEYLAKDQTDQGSFKQAIEKISVGQNILLVVGPEGGLSEEELAYLDEQNCLFIRLGSRILRTETAPLYALSALSFYFEEWRCEV